MLTVTRLTPRVSQILDGDRFGATLVTGTSGALLLDTLSGAEDLRGFVEGLTRLPLTVVNSHGHFDHAGGNDQFEAVYLSPLDFPVLERNRELADRLEGDLRDRIAAGRAKYDRGRSRLLPLEPGQVFDLGDSRWEAVALPGHTAGSMGLLCREEGILLAGDAFTPQMCLFFPESLEAGDYAATVERAMALPFDRFVLGHYDRSFPKELLEKLLACARLPETARGHDFVYLLLPEFRGRLYFQSYHDPEAGDAVCIITRPENKA